MNSKTVLITGASRGIGKAIALYFAKKSVSADTDTAYRIVINCRNRKTSLDAVAASIEALHVPVLSSVGDVGDYDYCRTLVKQICDLFGPVDILINNAGISHIGLLSDMKPEEWGQVIRTNLTSVYNLSSLCIPSMITKGEGKILSISSVWGITGASCEVAYSASKGGIHAFTKALAKELAPSGVQVNAIACGAIDTEMNHFLSEEDRQALMEEIPAGRMGQTDEAAELAYTLCHHNPYLTGQVISLDGAWI